MAQIQLAGVNTNTIIRLNTLKYLVNINFLDIRVFDRAVELNFNPTKWLKKNFPNELFIEGINLKEIETWH